MNRLYTAQEVADRLKIKKTTVYELIKRGELASSKIGKQLRISEEHLEQYLRGGASDAPALSQEPEFLPESSLLKRDYLLHSSGLILSGQTSPALELLCSQMEVHPQGIPVLQSHINTYNGLYSLYFGKVHVAAVSLPPEEISFLVPGVSLAAVCLYEYPLGFYVRKGNPKGILSVRDLARADVILANREKGSTGRMWLDKELLVSGINPVDISGYRKELVSDLSTAAAVSSGKADAAVGEESAARQSPFLDFVPLADLPAFLVMEADNLEKKGFSALVEIIQSEDFKTGIQNQTGYDVRRTGQILYLK